MQLRVKIADAANTYCHALLAITNLGYRLARKNNQSSTQYCAILDKTSFSAVDPLTLLAKVKLGIKSNNRKAGESMGRLSKASLQFLTEESYDVQPSTKYSDDQFLWVATKTDVELIGDSPESVLALSIIVEMFGGNWQETRIPDSIRTLL